MMANDFVMAKWPNQRLGRKFGGGLFQDCDGGKWMVWSA